MRRHGEGGPSLRAVRLPEAHLASTPVTGKWSWYVPVVRVDVATAATVVRPVAKYVGGIIWRSGGSTGTDSAGHPAVSKGALPLCLAASGLLRLRNVEGCVSERCAEHCPAMR